MLFEYAKTNAILHTTLKYMVSCPLAVARIGQLTIYSVMYCIKKD